MRVDPLLYTGRPAETRIAKEERCYDMLDALGLDYCRADHDHADTIEDCREVEALLGCPVCKNLLLTNRQMTELYLLLIPGAKPFRTKLLSKQIGTARLSFATAEQMEKHLDITPGSVSVLGLMNDKEGRVHLLIDRDIMAEPYFACHPCINTSTLRFTTSALLDAVIPAMKHEPSFVELPWQPEE